MTEAQRIDGKAIAADVRATVALQVAALKASDNLTPGLAVVLVGEDPASQIYVRNKGKQTVAAGMQSFEFKLPAEISQDDLLMRVAALNADPAVHGILVQMPLPGHLDENAVVNAIDPDKDVDGLHPVNAGRLSLGEDGLAPCTPQGCMILLDRAGATLEGATAVVIGRSKLVGKPMAQLLLGANATVTMAHSRTRDLADVCRSADILVAAVGRPEMVRADWIKPGATVIDVGMNRLDAPDGGKAKLVGDVAFDEAAGVARAITPVPGGVGPMTIACLLSNTVTAACRQAGIAVPSV
ncbi:MAG: bifunctional methylenetetrahydrofolate dehydrogenase/methenyltetrahydrofolate cyclohydrolase FolD [Alphaproteobacteria bacterium]|nr:bifunctional methylenetetrahydrofolate dehydrogenase/methenyltetrahydrofolate cyclohydrolase FolD [Alphaproteobacteria bacterium]